MNYNLIKVLCNPEFWIAVGCAFIIAMVVAYIAQDVWDNYKSLCYEEHLEQLSPVNRPILIGEKLYDTHEESEVVYIGQSDNDKPLVVYQEDNVVFIAETNIKDLRLIEE